MVSGLHFSIRHCRQPSCPHTPRPAVYYIGEETQQQHSVITTESLDVSGVSRIPGRFRKRCSGSRAYRLFAGWRLRNGYIHSMLLRRDIENLHELFLSYARKFNILRCLVSINFPGTWRGFIGWICVPGSRTINSWMRVQTAEFYGNMCILDIIGCIKKLARVFNDII